MPPRERTDWKKRAERLMARAEAATDLALELRRTLTRLANTAENVVGSHPEPTVDQAAFDEALQEARSLLDDSEGFDK